jgi:hypothetical protein
MTTQQNLSERPIFTKLLFLRMLLGALIGLGLISFMVFGVDHPNPDWPKYWRVRPLIVTPLAGAVGAAFFHFTSLMRYRTEWMRLLANIFSFLVFIIGLWMGTVLGLVGTMWN